MLTDASFPVFRKFKGVGVIRACADVLGGLVADVGHRQAQVRAATSVLATHVGG